MEIEIRGDRHGLTLVAAEPDQGGAAGRIARRRAVVRAERRAARRASVALLVATWRGQIIAALLAGVKVGGLVVVVACGLGGLVALMLVGQWLFGAGGLVALGVCGAVVCGWALCASAAQGDRP